MKLKDLFFKLIDLAAFGSMIYIWKYGSNIYLLRYLYYYEFYIWFVLAAGTLALLVVAGVNLFFDKMSKAFKVENPASLSWLKPQKKDWFSMFWRLFISIPMTVFAALVHNDKSLAVALILCIACGYIIQSQALSIAEKLRMKFKEELPKDCLNAQNVTIKSISRAQALGAKKTKSFFDKYFKGGK